MPDQFPDATKMVTLCDRIALALCQAQDGGPPCPAPCIRCRAIAAAAAAAAHEIADYFGERYEGASTTADHLYAVGCHQPAPQAGWQPIDPGKEAMALAVTRELRRHDA